MTVGTGGKLYVNDRILAEKLLEGGCNDTVDGDSTISVNLFIMAIVPGTDATDYCTYSGALDLLGPSPPNDVTAGPGDTSLILNFTAITDPDSQGYQVFCDDGTGVPSQGGGGAGGSGGTSITTDGGGGAAPARWPGWQPGPQFFGSGGAGGAVIPGDVGVGPDAAELHVLERAPPRRRPRPALLRQLEQLGPDHGDDVERQGDEERAGVRVRDRRR